MYNDTITKKLKETMESSNRKKIKKIKNGFKYRNIKKESKIVAAILINNTNTKNVKN